MQHNSFNLYLDIINPIYYFWKDVGLDIKTVQEYKINVEAMMNHRVIIEYYRKKNKYAITFLSLNSKFRFLFVIIKISV